MARSIYLDYHASTPVDPRVVRVMLRYLTEGFGNASSADHSFGDEAAEAVGTAERQVAALVGARSSTVLFTSGATESINMALRGFVKRRQETLSSRTRIAVSPTEHSVVLDTCRALVAEGVANVEFLRVDRVGQVDLACLEQACRRGLDLICVMAANNEIGTLSPIRLVAQIAARSGVAYLCDATQAAGRIALDADGMGITLLALSGHKLHGPQGVGALIVASPRILSPLLYGGGQQKSLRPGTLNVPGIAALGEACRLRLEEMREDELATRQRRDRLQTLLQEALPDLIVNGDSTARLAGNLHISWPRCPNGAIVARVRDHLAVATGAACSSGLEAPSHVLRAIGLPPRAMDGALRIGLGKWTTDDEVESAAGLLIEAIWAATNASEQVTHRV